MLIVKHIACVAVHTARLAFFFFLICPIYAQVASSNSNEEANGIKMRAALKILSQNQSLDFSRLDSIHLVIPYLPDDAVTRRAAGYYAELAENQAAVAIQGKHVVAHTLPAEDVMATDWSGFHGVLILKSDTAFVKLIKEICVAYRLLSLSFQPKLLEDGISAAIDIPAESTEPRFWFNLAGIRLEGAEFSADVLRLASYIRDGDRTLKVD